MIARRFATAVAALLAVAGSGACGGVTTPTRRTEAAAIAPGPATAVRAITPAQASTRTENGVRNVPPAFPLPPGSSVTDLLDRESGASFTLTAPDPQAVLSFYRRQLPRGPFTIVADRTEPGATSLAFHDDEGWAGTIFATTHRVAVAVRRA